MKKIHLIAAARPNFMKIAPLYHALDVESWCEVAIVHTGQHYDSNMSDAFFHDLRLPRPNFHLEIGSGSHAEQTGRVMIAYEKIALAEKPDWIVVVGDVNSTAACALVGAKAQFPVVHLEAGLRSRDRRMPEEINRLVTDSISDVHWTPSRDADANLIAEGVDPARIDCVGNMMIDSYEMMRFAIESSGARRSMGLAAKEYGVVTLHRPSNVDSLENLTRLVRMLNDTSGLLPLIFAVHPRTRVKLSEFGLEETLKRNQRVRMIEPLGYVEFMNLVVGSCAVITDSGGIQEESTYLGIPCFTLRENTERPITITEGSNQLASPDLLPDLLRESLGAGLRQYRRPDFWDGRSAQRAVASLRRRSGLGG